MDPRSSNTDHPDNTHSAGSQSPPSQPHPGSQMNPQALRGATGNGYRSSNTDPGADIADIERQNTARASLAKSGKLRTKEDAYGHYDEDRPKRKKPRRFLRLIGWLLLIVVLTGALGGVGWYFWLRKEPKDAPASQSTGQTTQPVGEGKDNYDDTVVTKHFTSSAFGLDFDYPEQWKAAEGADNKIVVISPAMKFNVPGDEGTEYAQVIFTVQHKQSSLPEFKTGNALAVRESEKMAYKKPSQVQRANTYLSFLNYAASKSKGIDGVYITGDFGYTKDQYVPQDEVVKADPLITVAFRHCNDDYDCKTPGDLMTVSTDFWDTPEAAKDIKTLLESIVVQ